MKVFLVFLACVLNVTKCHRISFTRCENVGWTCAKGEANDIIFDCNSSNNTNYTIYVKDFYTPNITSVTIRNCPNLKLYIDCPLLRSPSQLETFIVRDCRRLEFSHSEYTNTQVPASIVLENIGFIESIPTDTFHDPRTTLEKRCVGKADGLHNIIFRNSNIGTIDYKAINNVTTPKGITFQNVSIGSLVNDAIKINLQSKRSLFKIHGSNLDIQPTSINVVAEDVIITSNFLNIKTNGLNAKAHLFKFYKNTIKEIETEGITLTANTVSITHNQIDKIKSNGLSKIQCADTEHVKSNFEFSNNSIEKVESLSLDWNLASCLFDDISMKHNKIDCRCKNWATSVERRPKTNERDHIMLVTNGNTCFSAPCRLPVEIVEVMQKTGTCHLDLDPKLMCVMYNDSKTAYEIEEITTERPNFYIVKAISIGRDTKADSIEAIKRDIQKDASLKHDCNITNATSCVTIPITFDDTKSFVDTLRRTNSSKANIEVRTPYKEITSNNASINCADSGCTKDLSSNKNKALEFYKYMYLQLRSKNGTTNFNRF